MNRRERVFAVLNGEKPDYTPVGFWLHFPAEARHGRVAVDTHLSFVRETDTDILKIMNENILHDEGVMIYSTADLHKFRGFTRHDANYRDQMDIIRALADNAKSDYPILTTVHGLVASAFHETGFSGRYTSCGYCLPIFCREKPQEMKNVFRIVAESLMELVDCSLEAGADGIFYAALGGERHFFTDEEFAEFVLPYEQQVYDYIKARTRFNVLHICKSNIALSRYVTLKPAIVNWGVYANGVSLTEGGELFPDSIILGGFPDRHGVLVDGTEEEIRAHTEAILSEMRGKPFIVGSDCTLPTDISTQRIRSVVGFVHEQERRA